jgi:hypothetical protein
MAHIGCVIEDENGNLLIESDLNFADLNDILWDIDPKKKNYPWLLTIAPFADTTFNVLQRPYIIDELKRLSFEVDNALAKEIDAFITFIASVESAHEYIKFIGD